MRTYEEVYEAIMEHAAFMKLSCAMFDNGALAEAKRLANSIYTLVFDSRKPGGTVSVLTQAKDKKSRMHFISSCEKYEYKPNREFMTPMLLRIVMTENGIQYMPRLGVSSKKYRDLTFEEWWVKDPIYWYKDVEGYQRTINRKDLVISITDKDNGRHFDPHLPDGEYKRMKTTSEFYDSQTGEKILNNAELYSVRQIAWELLESIKRAGIWVVNIDGTTLHYAADGTQYTKPPAEPPYTIYEF